MLLVSQSVVAQKAAYPAVVRTAATPRAGAVCRTFTVPVDMIAAAGDVDAPVAVPIVAAIVVTAAVTFAVPAYLNRGQAAADKIFESKQKKPLDKAKTAKGKAPVKGKTTRR